MFAIVSMANLDPFMVVGPYQLKPREEGQLVATHFMLAKTFLTGVWEKGSFMMCLCLDGESLSQITLARFGNRQKLTKI
jgi:hypothetical protein